MSDRAIPTPATFAWEHLCRHMIGDPTGDVEADVTSALSRNYYHVYSDERRMVAKLRDIRTGRSKDTPQKWADDMARFRTIHDAKDRLHELLGHDAQGLELLRVALAKAGKIKTCMQPFPLGVAMLAVVREDAKSLLVASVIPHDPSGLDFRPCGERPYADYLRDLYREPPSGVFAVMEFGRDRYKPEDIVLNLSGRQIRSKGGTVDRQMLLAALQLVDRVANWEKVLKLASLADERERRVDRIPVIDAKIEEYADGLPVNVYDLLDALPPRGSGTWKALSLLASKPMEMEDGEG